MYLWIFGVGELILDEEIDEDNRANLRRVEHEGLQGRGESSPGVCESPPEVEDEVPVPDPDADSASETTGFEKVESEGKPLETETEVDKSGGDEAGMGQGESGFGFLKEVLRGEILGVPLWIWGAAVLALLVVAWVLSASTLPIERLE